MAGCPRWTDFYPCHHQAQARERILGAAHTAQQYAAAPAGTHQVVRTGLRREASGDLAQVAARFRHARTAGTHPAYRPGTARVPAYSRTRTSSASAGWHRGIAGNSHTDRLRLQQPCHPMSHPQRRFAMDEDPALQKKMSSLVLRAGYGNPRTLRADSGPIQPARSSRADYWHPRTDGLVAR